MASRFTGADDPLRLALARFREWIRLPEPAGYIPALTGWRGLCISLLLVGHFVPSMGALANVGVEFFFVLSGRLMAEILIIRRQNLLTFAGRRAARVLPSVWFYCFVLGSAWAIAELWVGASGSWLSPVAALLFAHNYLTGEHTVPFLQHLWSLAVEEHGYFLLAGISLLTVRDRTLAAGAALFIAALAVANGFRLSPSHDPAVSQNFFWRSDVRAASILIPFAICLLLRPMADKVRGPWLAPIVPVCAVGAVLCLAFPQGNAILSLLGCTILAGLAVNLVDLSTSPLRRLLEQPLMIWLGILSFSLYLWQQPFYLLGRAGFPLALCVLAAFLCALWNFRRVEWPARIYLNDCRPFMPSRPNDAAIVG